MKKYYDQKNQRLVFTGQASDEKFWNGHWQAKQADNIIPSPNSFVATITQRYLPRNSKILEGGCGLGDKIYALKYNGYEAYGIDYAKETIEKVNQQYPELNARHGDVRNLPFEDAFFDGYWSLGVIEHFYDGYDKVIDEASRILKTNGYLFLTTPVISLLRKLKAKLNIYSSWQKKEIPGEFYQFAFDFSQLISDIERKGFKLTELRHIDGIKGLKDEVSILKPLLQCLYDSDSIFAKLTKSALEVLLRNFTNHAVLLVFQRSG